MTESTRPDWGRERLPPHEAVLYEKLPDSRVRCHLCAHRCVVLEGQVGICHVRQNLSGTLYSLVYGRTISQNVDPIEKKPLYHFFPGSSSYSIATPGCTFHCHWCQNADISQLPREQHEIVGDPASPEQVVRGALQTGSRSIAYTYTEPTVFFEYAYDIARLARAQGLANVFVTNGYQTSEALAMIGPYLDAANVDLKAFRDATYRKLVGARLDPVLDTLKRLKRMGVWIEVTTLVVPTINDDERELEEMATFVARELAPDTPWHISRFFPRWQMTHLGPTPLATLHRAREIGRRSGLRHVYVGNLHGEECTDCASCGVCLIQRSGYYVSLNRVDASGCCPCCGAPVAGVGMSASRA